jgi:type I restriction enzyme S subunit
MKLETFFEKFDEFADAPDAVAKMRELVLQLAVQGRLVSQSPSDEPADTLAATIAADRAAFVKKRSLARQRVFPPVEDDQCPFALPSGWAWTRLGNLCRVQAGFAFESAAFVQGDSGLPIIRIRDITKDHTQVNYVGEYREEFLVDAGDYLVGMDGNFTVAKWRGPRALLNQRVSRLQWYSQHLEPSFFAIAAQYRLSELQGTKAYTTVDHLSSGQIENAIVPLPPLAEQKRIVAKVDELMALCDRLEAQQQEREEQASQLSRASLARFADAPTPANLPFLFHPSYAIPPADLRNSIIDAASRGALSPAVITGKPVRETLDTRRSERRQAWIRLKGRSSGYEEPDRIEYDDFPMLPKHWGLETLGLLGEDRFYAVQTGPFGSQLLKTEFVQSGVPVVAVGNLTGLGFSSKRLYHITKEKAEQLSRYDVQAGDLLFARTGATLGKVCLAPNEAKDWRMTGHILRVRLDTDTIDPRLVVLFLWASDFVKSQVSGGIRGMTRPGFNTGLLERILIPVPPLAEQRRIVAKVEQLMALVDALETQLAASRATAANLLSALVAELTTT